MSTSVPRSLTQMLRDFDDETLAEMLRERPDLAEPAPTSFSQLASHATTRESVALALDDLDAVELWVARQFAEAAGPLAPDDVDGLDLDMVADATDRLRSLALLWGDPGRPRAVRVLAAEFASNAAAARIPPPRPQSLDAMPRVDPVRVEKAAAGSAFELVRRTEVLIEHAELMPLRLRGDGALAQREGRALAGLLDLPAATALFHAELAMVAGLIGVLPFGRSDILTPTALVDEWQDGSLAEQWMRLAVGWRDAHPPSGDRALKTRLWQMFGPPTEGRVVDLAAIREWLGWHLPRRAADASRRAAVMLRQASWIGVTGLGAIAPFAPAGDDLDEQTARLAALLPERADTVLVQNDLTVIAPAPLTPTASRDLAALADVESRGGATVYRLSTESLRRAHALGWSSTQMRMTLEALSSTGLPQPLLYLIGDLERRRSGEPERPAGTTRAAAPAGPQPAGHPRPVRLAAATRLPGAAVPADVGATRARDIVHALRMEPADEPADAGGVAGTAQPTGVPRSGSAPVETLREAIETGEVVWIGYVDSAGAEAERIVRPSIVEDGMLAALDVRSDVPVQLPISRIRTAHIIRGGTI